MAAKSNKRPKATGSSKKKGTTKKTTENADILRSMIHRGCASILKNVRFVVADVQVLKKYHALEGIDLLEHVIVVRKSKSAKKQNIFIMQM